jgi:hypothetical protein
MLVAAAPKRAPGALVRLASCAAIACAVLLAVACGRAPGEDLFGADDVTGAGGAGGSWGNAASTSSSTSSNASSTTSASTTTTGTTSAGPTTSATTTSTGGPVCGDGVCDAGEPGFCPQDCAGACAHPLCTKGDELDPACDACVATVCQSDAYCCDGSWDAQCVGEADELCGKACCGDGQCNESCSQCPADCGACTCGDGQCDGETCSTCEQDCGACPSGPSCPHSVCSAGVALGPNACPDPCVAQVCQQMVSCCSHDNNPGWPDGCSDLAQDLCGADPCVVAVCQAMPSCCSGSWTQACVDQAKAHCNTPCNCPHSECQDGAALTASCSPCAAAVCQADPYCCQQGWDGTCKSEASSICQITCN